MQTIDIGSRRELFVDRYLIDRITGDARLRLQQPTPREVALVPEAPWEAGSSGYITVFEDEGRFRMYYKGRMLRDVPQAQDRAFGHDDLVICYAESGDGVHWRKPSLGLFEFQGSTDNNIVWMGKGSHGFAPFKDTRPDCPPQQRYKAFGRSRKEEPDNPPNQRHRRCLFVLTSPDGLRWTVQEGPKDYGAILDRDEGHYDSQNTGFWDEADGIYRAYVRVRRAVAGREDLAGRDDGDAGISRKPELRDIALSTSEDFLHWSKPQLLSYPGAADEELYTNQIIRYHRAPHIFLGFPTRYVEGRGPLTEWHERMVEQRPGRFYTSYTDALLMSSRDGRTFHRWGEAFLRPAMPEEARWAYGECYLNWGMLETAAEIPGAADELSFYASEGYRSGVRPGIRRYTLRKDGFVSVNAAAAGGEMVTKPLTFQGPRLLLNMSTSAAGSIAVEVRDAAGRPVEGFNLSDCPPQFGNTLEREIRWTSDQSPGDLAGKPVRLRFVMHDADVFSLRFA